MNPNPITGKDAAPMRSVRQRLDQLEAQMWNRARMNLMLLYNGSPSAGGTTQANTCTAIVGPIAVASSEI